MRVCVRKRKREREECNASVIIINVFLMWQRLSIEHTQSHTWPQRVLYYCMPSDLREPSRGVREWNVCLFGVVDDTCSARTSQRLTESSSIVFLLVNVLRTTQVVRQSAQHSNRWSWSVFGAEIHQLRQSDLGAVPFFLFFFATLSSSCSFINHIPPPHSAFSGTHRPFDSFIAKFQSR